MAKTILIVDDSLSMRQLVKMSLTGAGHQVIEACDGRDALNKLTGQKIHLIISDVNMPNLDGIGLVKEIAHHRKRAIEESRGPGRRGQGLDRQAIPAAATAGGRRKTAGITRHVLADSRCRRQARTTAPARRPDPLRSQPGARAVARPAATAPGTVAAGPGRPERTAGRNCSWRSSGRCHPSTTPPPSARSRTPPRNC